MAKKSRKPILGIKITKGDVPKDDWSVIHRFAVALERGGFVEYVAMLQNTKKLLWKSFVSGVGKGFGAVIGATIVVALVVALLALIAGILPDPVDNTLEDAGKRIEQGVK